jgi:ATP-dependent phosphofructokinase / diphosphate-dependent phosphofructokinase
LDGLIGIGGDGSLAILSQLARLGNWRFIGIPKTIDNDVACTERVIGFDTAVNTITDAINRLTFTASSHDRVMVVEVMGRKVGHLALHAGIAGGADVILIPELPYSIHGICNHLAELRDRWGRRFAIVVVAEGIHPIDDDECSGAGAPERGITCGMGQYIANQITRQSDRPLDIRVSVLGHIQRGGIPSALDRLVATVFGKTAVDLLAQGKTHQMVAWKNNGAIAVPLDQVLALSPLAVDIHSQLIEAAQAMGIYVGLTAQPCLVV